MGRKGQTCDHNLGLCSPGPSPADRHTLVRPFLSLGGLWDLPATVSRHPVNTEQLGPYDHTDPQPLNPAQRGRILLDSLRRGRQRGHTTFTTCCVTLGKSLSVSESWAFIPEGEGLGARPCMG